MWQAQGRERWRREPAVESREQYREALRTGLAKGMSSLARGLAAASRALGSTARQLRPPEPAPPAEEEEWPRWRGVREEPAAPAAPEPAEPATPPEPAPPATPETAEPASPPEPVPTEVADEPVGDDAAEAEPATPTVPEASSPPPPAEAPADVAALAELTVRELRPRLGDLTTAELTALREAEEAGRSRKTVLADIDRALAR